MKVELHANQGKVIDGHRDARGVGMSGRYYANAFMGALMIMPMGGGGYLYK